MKQARGFLGLLYRHHLVRYIFVGGTTFLIDVSILVFCHEVLNVSLEVATSISYWCSVLYNFCLNRWWTFSVSEEKALHEHAFYYGLLLVVNYVFAVAFVSIVSGFVDYRLAKALATIIQVSWTYPLYKRVIFKRAE